MSSLHAAPEPTTTSERGEGDLDDLLRRGLDWIERVAPYDLAAILVLEGHHLVVRCARGRLASEAVRGHRLDLAAFPTIREALETRRARGFSEDDHAHGDGDPFDGVLDLAPGHSCMVVPLCAGNVSYGVMTLDRERCEAYAPAVVNLVEVYGQVLALAIVNAQRGVSLARLHERDREQVRLLERELVGTALLDYDDSNDSPMRRLVTRARQVAMADAPVLICGEDGAGKGRLARAVHGWSKRAQEPFVAVDCTSEGDCERDLFGSLETRGRVDLARGGTLYLSSIHALPLALQRRLVRALDAAPDVRLIAASSLAAFQLEAEVGVDHFDAELFERLVAFTLNVPALRERGRDLAQLCAALLSDIERRTGRQGLRISDEGLKKLCRYGWPGNVRELATVLERAAIVTKDPVIDADILDVRASTSADHANVPTLASVQRQHIAQVLKLTDGRIYGSRGAAALLGLKPSTLQSKMKKLGLTREADARKK